MKSVKRGVLVVMIVAVLALAVVGPAFGQSVSNKQVNPGVTTRVVWDSAQVACYKLPNGINHTGNIHMEVTFKPNWADFDIYLLNASNQALNEAQGYMGTFTGKEVIDFNVPRVLNQTIEPGDPYTTADDYMVGDTYYVVIVAFSAQAKFQIWGYYPQIDLSVGTAVNNPWNWYMQAYRKPSSKSAWTKLHGPNYGYPYDFTPTSTGDAECRLQWPANVATKTVTYDPINAPSPANMEQYLYAGSNWDTVFEDYGDANWTPSQHGTAPDFWYGLLDQFTVGAGAADVAKPLRALHYIPSLYLVAKDPMLGGLGDLKTGVSTVGYKATFLYPENLRLASAPARVKKGAMATLKGTFALNAAWMAGAKVKIQMNSNGAWKTVKTVTTDANGKWTAKVKVSKTASYRASATGDPATGLATELSITKRVKTT